MDKVQVLVRSHSDFAGGVDELTFRGTGTLEKTDYGFRLRYTAQNELDGSAVASEMRLETHFLVSLFVCIIGLLTTVNGNVTYPAVDEPTNWRALGFAFGLFLVLFVLGALWNRIKWIVLQKRNARKKHSAQPRTVINSKKS